MDGRTGELSIAELSLAGFHALGKTKLLDAKETWRWLARAWDWLLLRDQRQ